MPSPKSISNFIYIIKSATHQLGSQTIITSNYPTTKQLPLSKQKLTITTKISQLIRYTLQMNLKNQKTTKRASPE